MLKGYMVCNSNLKMNMVACGTFVVCVILSLVGMFPLVVYFVDLCDYCCFLHLADVMLAKFCRLEGF